MRTLVASPHQQGTRSSVVAASSRVLGHLLGVVCMATLIGLAAMGDATMDVLGASFDPQMRHHGVRGALSLLGVSAVLWFTLHGVASRVFARRRPRRVVALRGSTMVETLIVMPFLLLLISGLSQLTLLTVASLLSNLAGYNAGRAVWVWDAQGVSDGECEARAVDGAAHAVAPSVPDDFVGASGNRSGDSPSLLFAAAYDTGRDIEARSAGKLAFARKAVTVEVIRGPQTGASMTYRFHIAFPWFAYIWGQRATVAGRTGYYSSIRREYTLPRQP